MELSTHMKDYSKRCAFVKPRIVGFFSVDENGNYHLSTDKLAYLNWDRFKSDQVGYDLNEGADKAIIDTGEDNANQFYRYLADHPKFVQEFASSEFADVGFILNRHALRKISDLPYNKMEVRFGAYLFQGNIYLHHIQEDSVDEIRSRWGFKFEQYLLADHPDAEPVTNVPVNEKVKFKCTLQAKVDNHRLFYVAEMDGVICNNDNKSIVPNVDNHSKDLILDDLRRRNFLEIKTTLHAEDSWKFRKFNSKNIFLQSCFSGVNDIIIGYRNYDAIVHQIKKYKLSDMIKIGGDYWNTDVCINFLSDFLTFVKKCFHERIAKMPEYKSGMDVRKLSPIELIFERNSEGNVFVNKNSSSDYQRKYLHPWFFEKITIK